MDLGSGILVRDGVFVGGIGVFITLIWERVLDPSVFYRSLIRKPPRCEAFSRRMGSTKGKRHRTPSRALRNRWLEVRLLRSKCHALQSKRRRYPNPSLEVESVSPSHARNNISSAAGHSDPLHLPSLNDASTLPLHAVCQFLCIRTTKGRGTHHSE